MLGRDVVAVGRQAAEVGGALLDERQPPVREVGRDLNADVGHEPAALAHEQAHVVEGDLGGPRREALLPSLGARTAMLGGVGDLRGLGPVVARMGDEVLEDHLLEVAVVGMDRRERLERGDPLLDGLPYADEDAARERDLELAGGADRGEPPGRVLGRRAGVDGIHQPLGDRLQHEPLRGRDLAQARELVGAEDAQVGVREHPPLERALAGPPGVVDEALVPVVAEAPRHLGVDLRLLAGQDEQLLGPPAGGLVEQVLDLVRGVQVGAVGGERAVLAVAAARPRQRQREVAREGDPAHDAESMRDDPHLDGRVRHPDVRGRGISHLASSR
jgi:hypothetical protein